VRGGEHGFCIARDVDQKKSRGRSELIRSLKTLGTPCAVVLLGLPLHCALAAEATATTTDAPVSSADTGNSDQLQEIVVTATHRSESERDVPVSTTALSGDPLAVIGTGGEDIKQLAFQVPSLNIESSNGRAFPRLYIRGYGNTDYHDFSSQPVGLVVDDIDQENAALKGFPIFDQQDIEVLRGPQGTLFGRNAPAGVVKFSSAAPVLNSTDGYVSVSDGTYNTSEIELVSNVPVNGSTALRVSVQDQHRDNWIDDPTNNTTLGGYNDMAARVQLLVKPSDDLSILFNVHGHSMDGSASIFRANVLAQGSNQLVPGFDPSKYYADGPNREDLGTLGGNIHVNYELPGVTLQSISGYETVQKYFSEGDIDGGYGTGNVFGPPTQPTGPGPIAFAVQTSAALLHHEQITQEFRALTSGEGPFQAQGGLYLFYEDATSADNDYCLPGQAGDPTTGVCDTAPVWTQSDTTVDRQINNAEAFFVSFSYEVLTDLKLTAGARYTHDDKTFRLVESTTLTPPEVPPYKEEAVANNVSWDVSALYKITNDINAYARIATGFRAPSFGVPGAGLPIQIARSETTTSYETGIKADFLDHKARVSWDVYYYRLESPQESATVGDLTELLNAKAAYGRGTELQLDYHPLPALTLNISGAVNETQIDDNKLAIGPCFNWSFAIATAACTVLNPLNAAGNALVDGNPLPQAAKYMGDASVRYDLLLPNSADVYLYSDVSSRSSMLASLVSSTEFNLPNLTTFGVRLGYVFGENSKYEVAAFCRNCANQIRQVGNITFDDFLAYVSDSRVIGASFKAKF
jgi:iron complex outermembrane receptor protein